jgi:hypothetical protein
MYIIYILWILRRLAHLTCNLYNPLSVLKYKDVIFLSD